MNTNKRLLLFLPICRLLSEAGMIFLVFISLFGASRADSTGGKFMPGPVDAQVLAVIDGDSVRVRVSVWLDQELVTLVRLRGVDAPELKGRCGYETRLARQARGFVRAAVRSGTVTLTNISGGKYYGRVIADVTTSDGNLLASRLLHHGLARPYRKGRRKAWCG